MLRQLARHNLLLMLQYAVSGIVPILLVPQVARAVGLERFGELAIATAVGTYAATVVQYAFPITGPRRLAQLAPNETAGEVVLGIASAKMLLLAASLPCVLLVALAWGAAPGDAGHAPWLLMLALPVAAALNTAWHLQTAGRYGLMLAITVAGVFAALTIGFSLVGVGEAVTLWAAAISLCAVPLVVGLGTCAATLAAIGAGGTRLRWHRPWRELRGGMPLFLSQVAAVLYTASGPIVIGLLRDTQQAGAYGALERVTTAVISACLLTHTVAYPKLAQLYAADRAAYLRLMQTVIVAYLFLAACVGVLALSLESALAQFLFGQGAAGTEPLMRSALVWLILGVFGPALVGYLVVSGRGGEVLPLALRILLVVVCLGVPGVLLFGAWAWMAALAVSQALLVVGGWRAWLYERACLAPATVGGCANRGAGT